MWNGVATNVDGAEFEKNEEFWHSGNCSKKMYEIHTLDHYVIC